MRWRGTAGYTTRTHPTHIETSLHVSYRAATAASRRASAAASGCCRVCVDDDDVVVVAAAVVAVGIAGTMTALSVPHIYRTVCYGHFNWRLGLRGHATRSAAHRDLPARWCCCRMRRLSRSRWKRQRSRFVSNCIPHWAPPPSPCTDRYLPTEAPTDVELPPLPHPPGLAPEDRRKSYSIDYVAGLGQEPSITSPYCTSLVPNRPSASGQCGEVVPHSVHTSTQKGPREHSGAAVALPIRCVPLHKCSQGRGGERRAIICLCA